MMAAVGTLGGALATAALIFFGCTIYLAMALHDERRMRRADREQAKQEANELRASLGDVPWVPSWPAWNWPDEHEWPLWENGQQAEPSNG